MSRDQLLIPLIRRAMPAPMNPVALKDSASVISIFDDESELPFCVEIQFSSYNYIEQIVLWVESTWDTKLVEITTGTGIPLMHAKCSFSSENYRDMFILRWCN